jgi:hypothetical protein
MNKEDMIRMIESGEELPDYCQEEFDNIIFCKIKEQKNGKISIRLSRQVFTSYGRSQKLGISRSHDSRKAIRSDTELQSQGSRSQIHSSRVSKK